MIHQYKLNGYNIVLDMASGSVHSVDEVAYDVISMYEEKSQDEITEIILEKYKKQSRYPRRICACGFYKRFCQYTPHKKVIVCKRILHTPMEKRPFCL